MKQEKHMSRYPKDELQETLTLMRRKLAFGAWCAETSAGGSFNWRRPSFGQCAVTAMLVQDIFGGELMRGINEGDSHYWNLIDGREVDLTRDQFRVWAPRDVQKVERFRLESSPETMERYHLLSGRYLEGI
jgi:hypothetical protein